MDGGSATTAPGRLPPSVSLGKTPVSQKQPEVPSGQLRTHLLEEVVVDAVAAEVRAQATIAAPTARV
jgi:hypothetical protein